MRFVKTLGAASVVCLSTAAFAQDATPDAARIISDPLYLPLQGQVFGATSYDWGSTSLDSYNAAGVQTSTSHVTSNDIGQQLMYGITDDFVLRLDWGYDTRATSRHLVPTDDLVTRSSSGWTDPDFGITWRAIDQAAGGPFSLDLRADYSPDAFANRNSTDDVSGTVARGGQEADFGFTIGHETRDFTLAGVFDADWLGNRTSLNQNTGDKIFTDSQWNYRLGLTSQYRFTPVMSMNAGVGHTFANDANVFDNSNGLAHISQGGDFTDLNVALNYHFIPNTVVGSIGYEHNFYDNTRNLFPTAPIDNTFTRNRDEDVVGVTMRYVLN
jgi:hypothetical protein